MQQGVIVTGSVTAVRPTVYVQLLVQLTPAVCSICLGFTDFPEMALKFNAKAFYLSSFAHTIKFSICR